MVIDWTKLSKEYKGMWVALKDDHVTVISSAKTLKEAAQKAKDKGYNNPVFNRFPDELISFVGATS